MARKLFFYSLTLLGLAVLIVATWVVLRPTEPVVGGQPVSQHAYNLQSADQEQLKKSTEALKVLGSNAVPALLRMLNSKDTLVSRLVWERSSWLDKDKRVFLMRRTPPPKSLTSRLAALQALAIIGESASAAVPTLETLLMQGRPGEVFPVSHALGKIGKEAVPALSKGLRHTNSLVRQASAFALSNVGPEAEPALEVLIGSLKDPDPRTSDNAARALGSIGTAALPALLSELERGDSQPTLQALKAIRFMRPLRRLVTPSLHRLLENQQNPQIRAEGILALGEVIAVDTASLELVRRSLEDPSPNVQMAAVTALGHFGSRAGSAVPDLLTLLKHANFAARREILVSLGKIGSPEGNVLAAVQACLSDPDADVRASATNCLQRLGALP